MTNKIKKSTVFALLILFSLTLLIGCNKNTDVTSTLQDVTSTLQIDREIFGKILIIDKFDKFSYITFDGNTKICVTNCSIDCWRITNGYYNILRYKLQKINGKTTVQLYNIVGINSNFLTEEQFNECKENQEIK